jgi:hypothetical protein
MGRQVFGASTEHVKLAMIAVGKIRSYALLHAEYEQSFGFPLQISNIKFYSDCKKAEKVKLSL